MLDPWAPVLSQNQKNRASPETAVLKKSENRSKNVPWTAADASSNLKFNFLKKYTLKNKKPKPMDFLLGYFIKTRNIGFLTIDLFFSKIQNQRLGYNTSIKTRQITGIFSIEKSRVRVRVLNSYLVHWWELTNENKL